MNALQESIVDFTDEMLFEMYRDRADYTDEAVKIINAEIARRGLNFDAAAQAQEQVEEIAGIAKLDREEFEPLKYPFSKADVLAADAILRDSNVPYFIEKCDKEKILCCAPAFKNAYLEASVLSSDVTLPLFSVFVYKDAIEKAHELIEEHFAPDEGGCYAPLNSGIVDSIKAFSFNDVRFSVKDAEEPLDVNFESHEKTALSKLAEILLSETDAIEEEQGRVVFFYDTLEPLIDKLKNNGALNRTDFLAIMEMCQIYCEDPRYDPALNNVAKGILDFFFSEKY